MAALRLMLAGYQIAPESMAMLRLMLAGYQIAPALGEMLRMMLLSISASVPPRPRSM
jgi:hypothetical protein